ncbi:helix-turn-helix transcriptional regulator [Enterococcus sp. LJL98]
MNIVAKKKEIKIALIHNGLNQKELAQKIKISDSALSNFLNNRFSISADKAKLICIILHKKFDDLFFIKGGD